MTMEGFQLLFHVDTTAGLWHMRIVVCAISRVEAEAIGERAIRAFCAEQGDILAIVLRRVTPTGRFSEPAFPRVTEFHAEILNYRSGSLAGAGV